MLVFVALLPILAARPAFGSILVDAASSARGNTATNLTWSHTVGAGPENVAGGAVSFTGVEQGTPVAGSASGAGTISPASVAIASAPGEVVVDAVAARGNAVAIAPGGGQTQLWNLGTGAGGNDIIGGGSTAPGAASVTISWGLTAGQPWAVGAARLRPVRIVPDALIKLGSEAASAYISDNVHENPAVTQVKSAGVMSGATEAYNVRFENDGNVPGDIRVTGTPAGSGFTIRYLDETSTGRTADVSGAGNVIAGLPVGRSRVWTLEVTPSGAPVPVTATGSFSCRVRLDGPAGAIVVEAVDPLGNAAYHSRWAQ